jgi:transposase-like protein
MKAQDFRALVDELGDLTAQQRAAVLAALTSKGTVNEAIAMIENRFAADPMCGHCHSANFGTWGHASDLRRYKCKDCKRTFNALTGTPLAQLHRRDAWLDYARCLVDRISLRKAAELAGVCLQTSFRWRHRFLKASKNKRPKAVSGIVEADETFILKSQKGSRNVAGRKSRKRGGKAAKPGLSTDEHDAILIVRDRAAVTTDHILPDLEGTTFAERLKPIVAKDSVLVTDGRAVYGAFAHANAILHIPIIASHGEHMYEGFHIQNVNAYTSRFKGWMAPFKGVASKNLPSYLGWRRMIERDGDRLMPRHCLAEALG